jgi:beta-galactosidase
LPQGRGYAASAIALDWYSAVARLGVDVDFIGQHSDLSGYKPGAGARPRHPGCGLPCPAEGVQSAKTLFGPRSGSKTRDMHVPADLPPGPLAASPGFPGDARRIACRIIHSEPVLYGNASHPVTGWRELIRTTEPVLATFEGEHRPGSPCCHRQ